MIDEGFYKALALVLLEDRTDQWGNKIASPLKSAIEQWANSNREDIAGAVVKNLGKEELASQVANKIAAELSKSSSWSTNYEAESLKKRVMEKVATKLAEEQFKKLTQSTPVLELESLEEK